MSLSKSKFSISLSEPSVYTSPARNGMKFHENRLVPPRSVRRLTVQDSFPFALLSGVNDSSRWVHPIAVSLYAHAQHRGPGSLFHLHGHQIVRIMSKRGREFNIQSTNVTRKVNSYLKKSTKNAVMVEYFEDYRWEVVPGDWMAINRVVIEDSYFAQFDLQLPVSAWADEIVSHYAAKQRPEVGKATLEILKLMCCVGRRDKLNWDELRECVLQFDEKRGAAGKIGTSAESVETQGEDGVEEKMSEVGEDGNEGLPIGARMNGDPEKMGRSHWRNVQGDDRGHARKVADDEEEGVRAHGSQWGAGLIRYVAVQEMFVYETPIFDGPEAAVTVGAVLPGTNLEVVVVEGEQAQIIFPKCGWIQISGEGTTFAVPDGSVMTAGDEIEKSVSEEDTEFGSGRPRD